MNDRRRGLGRGLSALMGEMQADVASPDAPAAPRRPDLRVPIEKVRANPEQPRRNFLPEALEELAASIREKGIIQPIIVRERPEGSGEYEIVAGERRWRAAQMAQLHEVPVLVRKLDDTEVLEWAIIENIQRADLNPVEEAQGYRTLMERFGHTQERLAESLGKSRSHIANLVRLLTLPDEVLGYLRDGRLTAGHARALVVTEDPAGIARKVVAQGLSVREVERLVKDGDGGKARGKSGGGGAPAKDADTRALEDELTANLGMKVSLQTKSDTGAGVVSIAFQSFEQLDDLCRILTSMPRDESR